ncbi:MAG: preprotein translocase subunit SecE [Puniceicoccales bacterium]|nr:preprotein translocase subunit SecE [Puniceicoccales bacterium]
MAFGFLKKTGRFLSETAGELKKTSWPSVGEFWRALAVVLVGAVSLGLFISAVDFSLFQMVNLLMDLAR